MQRRSRALPGIRFQATQNDAFDQRIEIADQHRRIGDGSGFAQPHQFLQRGGLESALARQDLVEDEAEGVDIALRSDFLPGELFRRHIGRRAGAGFFSLDARRDALQPEVGDADFSGAVKHDIGGLKVAVDDAAFVRCGQSGTDLPGDLRGFVRREAADAANNRSQILAVHVFHGQEKGAVGFADIKDAANVRMRNLPGVAHLSVKLLERRGVLGKPLGEKLHRDDLSKGQVFSAKNFAHSASANQCNYAVALREDLPGREPAAADGVGTGQWIRNGSRARITG